jgi:DNA-binding MarR family transcriptional regulator|tara:strand:- start:163 stop:411 length:249 start_codon:yes stop_codon:yes gene_type:complete
MIKEFWKKLTRKRQSNKALTRKEQVLAELDRGQGTARQLSDRMGLKLSIVRNNLSQLHKKGLIRDTSIDAGSESVWEVVKNV